MSESSLQYRFYQWQRYILEKQFLCSWQYLFVESILHLFNDNHYCIQNNNNNPEYKQWIFCKINSHCHKEAINCSCVPGYGHVQIVIHLKYLHSFILYWYTNTHNSTVNKKKGTAWLNSIRVQFGSHSSECDDCIDCFDPSLLDDIAFQLYFAECCIDSRLTQPPVSQALVCIQPCSGKNSANTHNPPACNCVCVCVFW